MLHVFWATSNKRGVTSLKECQQCGCDLILRELSHSGKPSLQGTNLVSQHVLQLGSVVAMLLVHALVEAAQSHSFQAVWHLNSQHTIACMSRRHKGPHLVSQHVAQVGGLVAVLLVHALLEATRVRILCTCRLLVWRLQGSQLCLRGDLDGLIRLYTT